MMKIRCISIILLLAILCMGTPLFSQMDSKPFEFEFENKILRGLIESPVGKAPRAVVLIIPGYGRTDFVEGKWYYPLRANLVKAGLAVCLWDKMGCGNSDGEFDIQQPVENSAEEALAAIQKLKELEVPGVEKIGLWGQSRAGWICPLINAQFPIDFWISVSGTEDKENYGYLVKSNLLIAGKKKKEAKRLYQAWMLGHKIYCTEGSYEDYYEAIAPLRQDSTSCRLFGYDSSEEMTEEGRKEYLTIQEQYTSKGYFDSKTGLWAYMYDFDQTLSKINCPVLAIFGKNDSQVDWRKTKKLYQKTIGKNPNASYTVKLFNNCNHNIQKCRSCAFGEDLSELNWAACDGYYEVMTAWIDKHIPAQGW